MELNVKRFNLNEAAAWVCQQGARRRHGAAVQTAEVLVGVRFQAFTVLPESCLPACPPAVVQCQMQMSRGSCPGLAWLSSGSSTHFTELWPLRSARCRAAGAVHAAERCHSSAPQSRQQQRGDISESLLSDLQPPSSQPPQRKPGWFWSENKLLNSQCATACVTGVSVSLTQVC